ncbi:MAG: MBL fold metallo-hydrolase [Treponema sp.]
MEIKEIYTGELFVKTWAFMQDEKLILVDPGGADEELLDFINEKNAKNIEIMLTHGHFDHVGGIPYLSAHYNVIKIYIHKNDGIYLGKDAKENHIKCFTPIKMDCYIRAMELDFPSPTDYVAEGDIVNGFTVLHTPGHTEGSVCYYKENILFSGDTLFRRSRGRTDLLGGNEETIIKSLKRLATLPKETLVYPGHGSNTIIGDELAWIERL